MATGGNLRQPPSLYADDEVGLEEDEQDRAEQDEWERDMEGPARDDLLEEICATVETSGSSSATSSAAGVAHATRPRTG